MAKPFLDTANNSNAKRDVIRPKYWYIGKSDINGKGVFALIDIPKGADIGVAIYRAYFTNEPDKDYVRDNLGRYTNHSDNPNCKIIKKGRYYVYHAFDNIKKGTELTVDYSDFDFDGKIVFSDNPTYTFEDKPEDGTINAEIEKRETTNEN